MAMKTASPWWLSALFALGLLLLFLGERPLDHLDTARLVFSGAGALLVIGATVARLLAVARTTGNWRAVERTLLLCQAGVLLALVLYVTTTGWGQGLVGVDDLEPTSLERFRVVMSVLWSVTMVVSLVPLFMIEISLGTARRGRFAAREAADKAALSPSPFGDAVEWFRVREMAGSGLTIALAAAFLMVTCNIADQRNIRRDVSYFKTSSPGSATRNVAGSMSQPLKVLLFFPRVNQVKNEVRGYFEALAASTDKIEIEEHDRMVSAALAKEHKVNADGTVVLVYGDKSESVKIDPQPKKQRNLQARTELRELDGKVNGALMKLVRARRTAYLTVGHGELGDPDSLWSSRGMKAEVIKRQLRDLNYEVKDLGLSQGLGNQVPEDASVVLMLGPLESLLDEELAAIDRYLAGGGRVMIALDPMSNASLGPLEQRLGLRFDRTPVTDDKEFLVNSRTIADRRLITTNRFSSHASITTLSRAPARYGMVLFNAGSLESTEFGPEAKAAKRTFVVRSMATSFADLNGNVTFDEGTEKRQQLNLVAAVEDDTSAKPKDPHAPPAPDQNNGQNNGQNNDQNSDQKADGEGMRAMVFTDVDLFTDIIQVQVASAGALFTDAVKWLGGEENFAGETVSEKDVVIQHTRNQDELWFYLTIVGAPLLVLGFGLWFGRMRRSGKRRAS